MAIINMPVQVMYTDSTWHRFNDYLTDQHLVLPVAATTYRATTTRMPASQADFDTLVSAVLESIFAIFNGEGDEPRPLGLSRSMSVGDVAVVGETAFLCQSVGWRKVVLTSREDGWVAMELIDEIDVDA